MQDDLLQEIWDRRSEEHEMTRTELETLLGPHVRKSTTGWNVMAWTWIAFIAATLVCEGMNIYAFRGDSLILSIGVTATLLTLAILAYGIRMMRRAAAIDEADESLVIKLRRKLRFQRADFEAWHWMVALTFVFLSLAVSTLLDIEDGTYRINKPVVFAGILVAQLLFGYGAVKLGHYPFVRESRAILSDLENQVLSGTELILERKKAWRAWTIVMIALFTALLVLGIWRAMG